MTLADLAGRLASQLVDWLQPQQLGERLLHDAWVLPAVLLVELVLVGWAASTLRRLMKPDASARADVVAYCFEHLRLTFLLAVLLTAGTFSLAMRALPQLPQPLFSQWGWLHGALAIIGYDFALYWQHRFVHSSVPLWKLHQFHHSATEFTVLTGARLHPVESAIEGVFVGAAVALLGAPWQLVLGFGAVQLAYNGLRHSQWQRDWGWFGRWVLHPPAAHRLHHSDQPAHYGKNLAFMLPIWDHLFGTWRDHRGESVRLGVPGSTLGEQGWWHGVWSCYRDFWRSLVKPAQAAVAP